MSESNSRDEDVAARRWRWRPIYAFFIGVAISGSLDLAAYLSGAFNV